MLVDRRVLILNKRFQVTLMSPACNNHGSNLNTNHGYIHFDFLLLRQEGMRFYLFLNILSSLDVINN